MPRRILLIVALWSLAAPTHASVWYVDGRVATAADGTSWRTAFQTIRQGVDAAQPGDEVWVAATDIYDESVTLSRPDVSLYGGFRGGEMHRDQRRLEWLSGDWPSVAAGPDFQIRYTARGVTLDGFSASGAQGRPGIQIDADDVTVRNCASRHNVALGWFGGGILSRGDGVVIADCVVSDNVASGGGGLYVAGRNTRILRSRIERNTVTNQGSDRTDSGMGGGLIVRGENAEVRNNIIAWNSVVRSFSTPPAGRVAEGGGVYAFGEVAFVNNTVAHNDVIGTDGARGGGFSLDRGTFRLANNISYRNQVWVLEGAPAATGGGIYFPAGGNSGAIVTFHANYFYDDAPDEGVPPGTDTRFEFFPQFVSETDFHLTTGSPLIDIGSNAAIAAEDRDVDGGARLIGPTVDIGAYEFPVSPAAPAWARTYVRVDGDDRNDGSSWATARRSVASAISVTQPGGEVWAAAGTYPDRVTLKPGMALYGGFAGTETAPAARDIRAHETVLDGRWRGSVVTIPQGATGARLDGFTVRRGSGTRDGSSTVGGGVLSLAPNVTLANNVIEENHLYGSGQENWPVGAGGGAYVAGSGALILNNVVRNNVVETTGRATAFAAFATSSGGGLSVSSAFALVLNNLITGNRAFAGGDLMPGFSAGGGLAPDLGGGIIANNTIADNAAYAGPFELLNPSPAGFDVPVAVNNIIAFNVGGEFLGARAAAFSHNLAFGNTGALPGWDADFGTNGNRVADPLFASRAGGDYRLQPGSPAMDAGDPTTLLMATDLDGQARIQGAAVDIGAYEWTPGGPVTVGDAAAALRIAAGLSIATPDLLSRLNAADPQTPRIDLADALRLLRDAAR